MAKQFSKSFYNSKEWQAVRDGAMMRDKYLCVKCGAPAEEVHHIIHLTPENIWDPKISLNPDNLICLCKDCHFKEHYKDKGSGHLKKNNPLPEIIFDDDGNPIPPIQKF